jgi:hypothetical protein
MFIIQAILGGFFNRVRGSSLKFHTEYNFLSFGALMGLIYHLEWWGYFLMAFMMLLGSATGWTEGISGCLGWFNLKPSAYNWISKIVKPVNQWTTFLYMCIRGGIWVLCLEIGFMITVGFKPLLLLAIPLFYVSYRIAYYIPTKYRWALGEVIYGAIIWGLC